MTDDLRRDLFNELAMVQVGMLGIVGSGLHLQPMVHLTIPGDPLMWFLAEADSDLVAALGDGGQARFCLTGRNHDFHACLTGPIRPVPDRQGLEQVWSVTAEARFPGGLADIEYIPLRFEPAEAAVWLSAESAVLAGMEAILSSIGQARPSGERRAVLRLAPSAKV